MFKYLILVSLMICSCVNNSNNPQNPIVGYWEEENKNTFLVKDSIKQSDLSNWVFENNKVNVELTTKSDSSYFILRNMPDTNILNEIDQKYNGCIHDECNRVISESYITLTFKSDTLFTDKVSSDREKSYPSIHPYEINDDFIFIRVYDIMLGDFQIDTISYSISSDKRLHFLNNMGFYTNTFIKKDL